MGKSIKTSPPKFNVVFIGIFVVFKKDFLLSTKYCFLTLIFWGCHSKSFFSYLRYSGIVDSIKLHLKTNENFCCRHSQNIKVRKKFPTTLKVGERGGDLLLKEGITVLTCCKSQLVFARIVVAEKNFC